MKILLIEDEADLQKTVVKFLHSEGYLCETASNYGDAEEKVSLYQYDCILVDITLPGGNGLDLIQKTKKLYPKTGIIVVSARGAMEDKVAGLDLGADDYLAKPFHLQELNARIRAIIRRHSFEGNQALIFEEIKVLPDSRQLYINDKEVIMTGKEYDILLFFIINKGKVLSKEAIAEHVWGDYVDQANSLDFLYTHIKNLRKKMLDNHAGDYIKSIYGIGYKWQI